MKPHVPEWLAHLLTRPVAILGEGVSGRAAAGLVRELGAEPVPYDLAAGEPARRHFGALEAARHGLVVVSPGFAPAHEWVRAARSAGCEVLSELDFGSLAWRGEILAVTGTNGKTTVTEFLVHALRHAGLDARAAGNIGAPLSDAWRAPAKARSIAVCEVSSFQAEVLRFFEAKVTLWTNFAEDHLERHGSLESYFRAKLQLVRRTRGQRVFFGPSVLEYAHEFAVELPAGSCVAFEHEPVDQRLERTPFERAPQRENFLLVRALWIHLGLPERKLLEAARTFVLGAHRLARVREVRGVTYWNDSKATNFHAAEAALAGFDHPVLWIGGGRSKGGDLAGFAARISPRLRQAFLLGETAAEMGQHLRALALPVTRCASMREAVGQAHAAASSGDDVLLSPGFASFDMFRGYDDRGRHFEAAVTELSPAPAGRHSSNKSKTSNRPAALGLCLL